MHSRKAQKAKKPEIFLQKIGFFHLSARSIEIRNQLKWGFPFFHLGDRVFPSAQQRLFQPFFFLIDAYRTLAKFFFIFL